jgi:hypothetical protein
MKKDVTSGGEHRLFRAIVLMGGSMTLGCGGNVSGSEGQSTAGGNGGGTDQPGPVGGAAASTGGAPGAASGSAGSIATGGSAPIQAGGATAAGGTGPIYTDPTDLPCPPEQWRCATNAQWCDGYGYGYSLPEACACDPSRPVTAEDCGEGSALVCDLAVSTADGTPLDEPVPFGCACVGADTHCDFACRNIDGVVREGRSCVDEREVDGTVQYLCGCAVIVLR